MQQEINLRDYFLVIWRRKWVVVLVTLLLFFFALYRVNKSPVVYSASTTVFVRSVSAKPAASSKLMDFAGLLGVENLPQTNFDELIMLLQSKSLAKDVFYNLKLKEKMPGWNDPANKDEELINDVRDMVMDPKIDKSLMTISVMNKYPEIAALIANEYTEALYAYWNKLNVTESQQKKAYIEEQLPKLESELNRIENKIRLSTEVSPDVQRDYQLYSELLVDMKKQYEDVKLTLAKEVRPFTVLDKAQVPHEPLTKNKNMKIALFTFAGLMLGVFCATVVEYWSYIWAGGRPKRTTF